MMKKMLVLMMVLGLVLTLAPVTKAVVVNAADASIAVGGSTALSINVDESLYGGGDLLLQVTSLGGGATLDASGAVLESTPSTYIYNSFAGGWVTMDFAWGANGVGAAYVVGLDTASQVIVSGGNLSWNTVGAYDLATGISLTGVTAGDVRIDLIAYSDIISMSTDAAAEGGNPSYNTLYAKDAVIDSATVTVVPEPITIALLGLGGLFIRRRK